MLSYNLSNQDTKKLKELNELITQKLVFLDFLNIECKEYIHKMAKISTLGSSTRIENAILTNTEINWLNETLNGDSKTTSYLDKSTFIKKKLSKDKERSIQEVAGLRNVLEIIFSQAKDIFPLSEYHLRGLHSELLQYHPPASYYLGNYKTIPNNVVERLDGKIVSEVLKTADPGPITVSAMNDLFTWYNNEIKEQPWALTVLVEFIFRFLAIHPFQDGNGRLSRALFILGCLQNTDKNLSTIIRFISVDRQIEKTKSEYYYILRKCSEGKFKQNPKEYKIELLLRYYIKMFEQAVLSDIDFYNEKFIKLQKLTESQLKIYNTFNDNPEINLSTNDIQKATGIPRRTIIHTINILLEQSFIQKLGIGPQTKYKITF
ncbi:MAG: Fic family protein [Pseudomonadota bacterium]